MRKEYLKLPLLFLLLLFFPTYVVHAEDSNQTVKQYIADLQNSPNDNALREKIIKHVQTMKPSPQIPEEARRQFIKAQVLQKEAKDVNGYELAINAYKQALLLAPWWPEAYNNLGFVLELAGRFDEAISSFKLYIATNPPDSRAAQDKIYAIEAKKEMAQVGKTVKVDEKKKKGLEDLVGLWVGTDDAVGTNYRLEMHGYELWATYIIASGPRKGEEYQECSFYKLEGNRLIGKDIIRKACSDYVKDVIVSDDFNMIKLYRYPNVLRTYHRSNKR